jgi:ferredoxin
MGAAYIETAICQGCGTCASECPARAIQLMHYTDVQTLAKIDTMFGKAPSEAGFIPIESIELAPGSSD